MASSDIKFEDAGSCLARIAEAQGSIDAAFALLNDPVVKPDDAVKAAALLQHSLQVLAVAQRLLHDSRLGGVSLGPGVPSPGIAPLSYTYDLHYGGHRVRLFTRTLSGSVGKCVEAVNLQLEPIMKFSSISNSALGQLDKLLRN
jgi:hypothetical protein